MSVKFGKEALGRCVARKSGNGGVGGKHAREVKSFPNFSRNDAASGLAQAGLQAERRGGPACLTVVVVVVDRRGVRWLHVPERGEDVREDRRPAADWVARWESPESPLQLAQAPLVLPRRHSECWQK